MRIWNGPSGTQACRLATEFRLLWLERASNGQGAHANEEGVGFDQTVGRQDSSGGPSGSPLANILRMKACLLDTEGVNSRKVDVMASVNKVIPVVDSAQTQRHVTCRMGMQLRTFAWRRRNHGRIRPLAKNGDYRVAPRGVLSGSLQKSQASIPRVVFGLYRRPYPDQEVAGQGRSERYTTEIEASEMQMLGGGKSSGSASSGDEGGYRDSPRSSAAPAPRRSDDDDDMIPF